jgi:hypothetical protein
MKDEIYKKIYIDGKEDLPQIKGDYWSGLNDMPGSMDLRSFDPDIEDDFIGWQFIDWYLLPVEQKELMDEEIEKWAVERVNKIDPDEYGYGDLLIEGAKWAREQFKIE